MKQVYFSFIFLLTLSSCKENSTSTQKNQDSLFVVLHTQIRNFQSLPVIEKKSFSHDSLSAKDSILFNHLYNNYNHAVTVMDSIRHLFNLTKSEIDTLEKYRNIKDSAYLNRLKYLNNIQQNYIQEYFKSISIAEQNKALLQLLSNEQSH